jgi:transcriptional regulator with XRE-family HTH domain
MPKALYKSYAFKDKDPVIDRLRTMIQKEGMSYSEVSEASGVSVQTFYNWFDGATKKPQWATVCAVAYALGYKAVFRKGTNLSL